MSNENIIRQNRMELRGVLYKDVLVGSTKGNSRKLARITVLTEIEEGGKKRPYYNSIVVWDEALIEKVKDLKKGDGIEVTGRVYKRKYEENGQKRSSFDFILFEINKLEGNFVHVNKVELYGRTTSAPEVKTAKNLKFAKVTLAVGNLKSKNKEGQPDFLDMTVFNDLATVAGSIGKGKWAECICTIRNTSYKDKAGNPVYTNELIAKEFKAKEWEERDPYKSVPNEQSGNIFDDVELSFEDLLPDGNDDMAFI